MTEKSPEAAFERIQQEIGRGSSQLFVIQEDYKIIRKELDDMGKEVVVLKKVVEFTKELMNEKICEVKKDVNSIGKVGRDMKKEMKEYTCAEIKSSTRGIKLWASGITIIVLAHIVLILVTKFWG